MSTAGGDGVRETSQHVHDGRRTHSVRRPVADLASGVESPATNRAAFADPTSVPEPKREVFEAPLEYDRPVA
jgi:hypothetical protein